MRIDAPPRPFGDLRLLPPKSTLHLTVVAVGTNPFGTVAAVILPTSRMIPAILLVAAPLAACTVVEVHDADTIRCDGERIRISDIDAPELPGSPRCDPQSLRTGKNPSWCDYALGERSRDALQAFVATGTVMIHRQGLDRYGRTLATVSVNGRDAGEYLVGLGLARAWVK